MKAKVILTPRQKKLIDAKLKQAKQTRIIKGIAFNKNLSAETKFNLIKNVLK